MSKIKVKNILAVVLTLILAVACLTMLTACDQEDENTVKVSSYSELISALDGDKNVIKLTKDIDTTEASIIITKELTIDLNGKTITGNGCDGVFCVLPGGDLEIVGNGTVIAKEIEGYAMAIWARGGKATIKGGNFKQMITNIEDDQFDLIYASNYQDSDGYIEILGGKFESFTPKWTLNVKNANWPDTKIVVKGGTFVGFNPAQLNTDDADSYLEEGYKSTKSEGEYIVSEN